MEPEPMKPFDDQLKAWARRPPATSAAEASGQVLRRLAAQEEIRPRRLRHWGLGAAAAALGGALVAGFLSVAHLSRFEDAARLEVGVSGPASVVSKFEAPPVPEGVAVIWLDPNTPLYLTVNVPDTPEGDSTP